MVAQQDDHADEERDAEGGPDELGGGRLVPGGLQVEAVDEDQAEAVEEDRDGQDQRVGVRGAEADGEECEAPRPAP